MTTTGTPATLPEWITVLRAELTAAGVTATSPGGSTPNGPNGSLVN
jgi:hypothetical protein